MKDTILPELELLLEKQSDPEQLEIAPDAEPLDFLLAVMRDARQPMQRRMRAADIAANFRHPKVGVSVNINADGFAERLEKAILRSAQVYAKPLALPPPRRPPND